MASINSKKLLPPSKQSKQVFLVPAQSILPSKPNVNKLKPVDEKGASSGHDEEVKVIKKKGIIYYLIRKVQKEKENKHKERNLKKEKRS